ncbi:RNA polymerase sigma factor [Sphingobacterium phlebotomi]|uniref:RNA polymerase sigma factor n=2 Tax=Sphingobacterium phlebotomi TaxID=2605433 RepID=A0A5D4H2C7_9SPHI|nr:RNA polymerase sigma factor [Sphingobacterium phlebotomi]
MDNMNLDTLWNACLAGNRKAQFQLYQTLSGRMFGVCLRYAQHESEAEEILQAGFIKVFTKGQLFDNKGSLEGWIRKIMVNTAIELHRNKSRHSFESLTDDYPVVDSRSRSDENLRYKDLLTMVTELPLGYRTVFNLYVIEGYSHKEIAQMLSISEGNSKSQLSRARQWLKEKLMKIENIGL